MDPYVRPFMKAISPPALPLSALTNTEAVELLIVNKPLSNPPIKPPALLFPDFAIISVLLPITFVFVILTPLFACPTTPPASLSDDVIIESASKPVLLISKYPFAAPTKPPE